MQLLTKQAWKDFDIKNTKHQKMLATALQFSFSAPDLFTPEIFEGDDAVSKKFREKKKKYQDRMQAFTVAGDFPASPKEVIDSFHELPPYDTGYEMIFDVKDYSGSRKDGFTMVSKRSGLTFKKVLTGEKLKVFQMSGEKEYVYFDYYGGALNWHRSLFDNQDYWTIEDNAIEFRNEAFRIRAATFYALIEAAAATKANIAWQAHPDGVAAGVRGYLAGRDAATMNLAAQTIILAVQASGYGISPQTASFIVLTPLQLRGRVKQAFNYQYDNAGGSPKHIDYNFQQITTTMLATTDNFIVILPKLKMKAGYRMDLTNFSDFDMLAYVDTVAGWMAYGGAVGDTDQLERCDTA